MKSLEISAYLLTVCLLFTGCRHQRPIYPAPTNVGEAGYLDLQPGWRLRVIVPIIRTGGYIVPMTTKMEGHTISVTAGKDFLGYETDYYDIQSSTNSAVKIKFKNAETIVQGKKSRAKQPALTLFNMPLQNGFIRIVYLIRESAHDHDMVMLVCNDEKTLRDLTMKIRSNGEDQCGTSDKSACIKTPAGVAVIPENEVRETGKEQWKTVM